MEADTKGAKMGEKSGFLSWVGFKGEATTSEPNSVDRIRELENQLADLRSRRDITSLTKEEFEILATETAMSIIRSAQLRETKATAAADRVLNESSKQARDLLEGADSKAKSMLTSAEARGRKYINAAENDAQEILQKAETSAEALLETKRREGAQIAHLARREGEKIIGEATSNIAEYRQWLAGVISEAERLHRIQTQSLTAAEEAIAQSRARLDGAFQRLAALQSSVLSSLNEDGAPILERPTKVQSERVRGAISAPKKSSRTKTASKRKTSKKVAAKSNKRK
jgi:vacuolar-type H+-ATPase subunit H